MQVSTKVSQRVTKNASGDDVNVLAFSGDISSTSKEAILAAYRGINAPDLPLLLDFTSVAYVNSSGIAIIIQMLLEASKAGHRTIGIFGLSAHFRKVFTMVGIGKYASLYDDEVSALSEKKA